MGRLKEGLASDWRLIGGWRGVGAALAVLIVAVLLSRLHWGTYLRLWRQGAWTDGWVTAKDIVGRRDVSYSFTVGDHTYGGVGRAGFGNPEFDELSVGDKVLVFYLPKDPAVSALGDPRELLRQQNRYLFLGVVGVCALMLWVVRREIQRPDL